MIKHTLSQTCPVASWRTNGLVLLKDDKSKFLIPEIALLLK
jgi:hypothetical protein